MITDVIKANGRAAVDNLVHDGLGKLLVNILQVIGQFLGASLQSVHTTMPSYRSSYRLFFAFHVPC